MQLRARIIDAVKERLEKNLPEALASTWDIDPVNLAFEELRFVHTNAAQDHTEQNYWRHCGEFNGTARLHLIADDIDHLALTGLIVSLLQTPLYIKVKDDGPIGTITEDARLILQDLRDSFSDTATITALRFSLSGGFYERIEPVDRPDYDIQENVNAS